MPLRANITPDSDPPGRPGQGRGGAMILRLASIVIFAVACFGLAVEWGAGAGASRLAGIGIVAYVMLMLPEVGWSRRVFVLVGLGLAASAWATRPDWLDMVAAGLGSAGFVGTFFVALSWLRNAAAASPAIERCGSYLASQPPGRRYLALTIGGHLFSLILSYGAIQLLGNLATSAARREPNEEIRRIRTRRMLLAIQRGFVSMLAWSPLAFSMAISTSVVPGRTGARRSCHAR